MSKIKRKRLQILWTEEEKKLVENLGNFVKSMILSGVIGRTVSKIRPRLTKLGLKFASHALKKNSVSSIKTVYNKDKDTYTIIIPENIKGAICVVVV